MTATKLPIDLHATEANLHQVLKLCQQATILTIHRDGGLRVIIDDIPGNQRTCFDMAAHRRSLRITVLTDYDAENNCWPTQVSERHVEIPHRRGLKKLWEWCRQTNLELSCFAAPRIAIYYRRDGKLSK